MTLDANHVPNLESIALRLRNLIRLRGIDQNYLAEQLDITIQTLSKILNAKALPSTETLFKMAKYFDVSIDYILNGETKITTGLLYQHRQIAQEIENKIKDVEGIYHNSEISELVANIQSNKKTSIFDLIKIIIQIIKGGDESIIHQLISQLDDDTYQILRQLNMEFIESTSKRQRTEESK